MKLEELQAGQIVEYKCNGTAGCYEARVEGVTGGRVILRLLRHTWSEAERHENGPVVRVLPKRVLRIREHGAV